MTAHLSCALQDAKSIEGLLKSALLALRYGKLGTSKRAIEQALVKNTLFRIATEGLAK